jgi:hypothetical protein
MELKSPSLVKTISTSSTPLKKQVLILIIHAALVLVHPVLVNLRVVV